MSSEPRLRSRDPFISLSAQEREVLARAAAREGRPRQWKRYRAILLLAQGRKPAEVAAELTCSLSSVYNWASAWQRGRLAGLLERPHGGGRRLLDEQGEQTLSELVGSTPQRYGYSEDEWTAALLRRALQQRGYAVSERTIRRALQRLGWKWIRPRYRPGTPNGH